MNSRDVVLGRIRAARAGEPPDATPYERAVPRDYARRHGERSPLAAVDLLARHLADYRAVVHRCDAAGLPALLGRILAARGARDVLVPAGLPAEWLPAGAGFRQHDGTGASPAELDRADSVVTGCAVAIAETGTVVLDGGPGQGRRALTLVPDHHLCVVRCPDQVVDSVPTALDRLDPGRPLTWISGPSATSDIELSRVEGVHGPRTLEVVLFAADPPPAGTTRPGGGEAGGRTG